MFFLLGSEHEKVTKSPEFSLVSSHGSGKKTWSLPNVSPSYLGSEQDYGADAHPAVEGIQVGDVVACVEVKHSTQPKDGQDQGGQQQSSVHQLPVLLPLTPGKGDAV